MKIRKLGNWAYNTSSERCT